MTTEKTLDNTTVEQAKDKVSDLKVYGDGNMFKLLCKASSQQEGWMKSTKALEIESLGCVVQVTTQQRNVDGSYAIAEAVCFVPNAYIVEKKDDKGVVIARSLEAYEDDDDEETT